MYTVYRTMTLLLGLSAIKGRTLATKNFHGRVETF